MNLRHHIPNLITVSNLFCGLLALVAIVQGNPLLTLLLVALGLLFDFADGFVARLLRATSPMGKELDSLADLVTFGVVPGFVVARMVQEAQGLPFLPNSLWQAPFPLWWLALLIPLLSALRLAKFNLDERQGDAFHGLPTPAHTMLILSYWLILTQQPHSFWTPVLSHPWLLLGLSLASASLLVSDWRLLSLKVTSFAWHPNRYRYLLLLLSVGLLLLFQFEGVPFIIFTYILLSSIENLQKR